MTREHFLSDGALKAIGATQIQGLPWALGKMIQARSVTGKILCDRHNSGLSILDQEAKRFMPAIQALFLIEGGPRGRHAFDGTLIERWMLKVLCGAAYSGNLVMDKPGAPSPKNHPPPLPLLEVIYGLKPLGSGGGLYVYTYPPSDPHYFSGNGLDIRVLTDAKGAIGGISLQLGALFLHTQIGNLGTRNPSMQLLHRPKQILFQDEKGQDLLSIDLAWGSLVTGNVCLGVRRQAPERTT